MKTITCCLFLVMGVVVCAQTRSWTDATGRRIEGRLAGLSRTGEARIVTRDGRSFEVPRARLSREDQAYLDRMRERMKPPPIIMDASQSPDLKEWADEGVRIMEAWYPRIAFELYSESFEPHADIRVTVKDPGKGVAAAAGNRIGISANWIRGDNKDAHGVLIHELVHVVQRYRGGGVGWLTEGIADYIRFGVYEERPQEWFPVPRKVVPGEWPSYRPCAGFLYWLEKGKAPGIVGILNAAMREKRYDEALFEQETGMTLEALWEAYLQARKESRS